MALLGLLRRCGIEPTHDGQLIALGTQKELTKIVGEYDTLRLHIEHGQSRLKIGTTRCSRCGRLQKYSRSRNRLTINASRILLIAAGRWTIKRRSNGDRSGLYAVG
jgi:hypothetical protein